jgi:hypothetical protein
MPPAVDDEAGSAEHVHPLIGRRLASQLAHRQEKIGEQDEDRAAPPGDFDG